ncbi:unnamed protein product, partial [Prorocentrum cordatum]
RGRRSGARSAAAGRGHVAGRRGRASAALAGPLHQVPVRGRGPPPERARPAGPGELPGDLPGRGGPGGAGHPRGLPRQAGLLRRGRRAAGAPGLRRRARLPEHRAGVLPARGRGGRRGGRG